MARLHRIDIPDIAQHVIVRGVDRQPCFFADADYESYLAILRASAASSDCAIHAFVLMTNHVHLLLSGNVAGAVSATMHRAGLRYVGHVNRRHGRTGTLFEGRFRSSLVQTERYLLTCMRYIELNPVRACMVARPGDYRGSRPALPENGPDPINAYRQIEHSRGGRRQSPWSTVGASRSTPISARSMATFEQARNVEMAAIALRRDPVTRPRRFVLSEERSHFSSESGDE